MELSNKYMLSPVPSKHLMSRTTNDIFHRSVATPTSPQNPLLHFESIWTFTGMHNMHNRYDLGFRFEHRLQISSRGPLDSDLNRISLLRRSATKFDLLYTQYITTYFKTDRMVQMQDGYVPTDALRIPELALEFGWSHPVWREGDREVLLNFELLFTRDDNAHDKQERLMDSRTLLNSFQHLGFDIDTPLANLLGR